MSAMPYPSAIRRPAPSTFNGTSLAVLFIVASATTALAQPATTPGNSRIYSTIYSIGVEWDLAGDTNHSAQATVAYRAQGTASWATALPLVRMDDNGANM